MNRSEALQKDITRLHNQGVALVNALQVALFPAEMERHFSEVLKQDFAAFKKTLPVFASTYQTWYSEAQAVIKRFLPLRLADFTALYEAPKNRKEIRKDNYTLEDYLKDVTVTSGFDKKVVVGPADAVPVLQQQLNIFDAVSARLDSTVLEITDQLQADLLDRLLQSAKVLAQQGFGRSAGAVCTTILEQHFEQLRLRHQLKLPKKNAAIADYNKLFLEMEIYDQPTGRQVQYLGGLRDLCIKNKKQAPSTEQVEAMLQGTEKIVKTVF